MTSQIALVIDVSDVIFGLHPGLCLSFLLAIDNEYYFGLEG